MPLYTAPLAELFTCTVAMVPSLPFHAEMIPSSLANRNALPPKLAGVPLKTVPVGDPAPAPADGMVTTNDCGVPAPLYSVDVPLPLLAIQKGEVRLKEMPHGFTRFGSVLSATPGRSETRLV